MECVIGMSISCMTDANIKKARDVYKATEIILTASDFEPHGDVAALIHNYGMKAGYDLEYAWWAAPGFNTGYIPANADAKLVAIKAAGWDYAVSEGMGGAQVAKIKQYISYINMGGESGEDVYADGSMYQRPRSMADGNYLECYHTYAIDAMKNAFASANLSTPDNMGMTFMKYTQTADLEVNVSAMLNLMKEIINSGVKLKKMHFWGGIEAACVLDTLDGPLNPLYKGLENTWGFTTTVTPPIPEVLGGPIVTFSAQYTTDHDNGVDYIRGRARDKDGNPSSGRWTGLWKQDEKTGNWNGVAFVKVDSAAYFGYNLTKLLPKGFHVLRLQTDDGPLINMTPYQRW